MFPLLCKSVYHAPVSWRRGLCEERPGLPCGTRSRAQPVPAGSRPRHRPQLSPSVLLVLPKGHRFQPGQSRAWQGRKKARNSPAAARARQEEGKRGSKRQSGDSPEPTGKQFVPLESVENHGGTNNHSADSGGHCSAAGGYHRRKLQPTVSPCRLSGRNCDPLRA